MCVVVVVFLLCSLSTNPSPVMHVLICNVCVCVRVCVRACVRACVCVGVCVLLMKCAYY